MTLSRPATVSHRAPDSVPTEWQYEPNKIVIPATVSQLTEIPTTPAPPTDGMITSLPYQTGSKSCSNTSNSSIGLNYWSSSGLQRYCYWPWTATLTRCKAPLVVSLQHRTPYYLTAGPCLQHRPSILPRRRIWHVDDTPARSPHPVFLCDRQLRH
jgi:hypothetical protein